MPLAGYMATLPNADIQKIPAIASPQKLNSDRPLNIQKPNRYPTKIKQRSLLNN
jgi:hypothetical protein